MKSIPQYVSESVRKRNPHLYQVLQKAGNEGWKLLPPDVQTKRIRQSTKPLMNKLESEFFEVLKYSFKIIEPQSVRLMLGRGIWYKPDFIAWPCGLESQDTRMRAFECKGPHSFRGGMENLKVAAHKYPQVKFTLVWKQDGKWQEQTVLP